MKRGWEYKLKDKMKSCFCIGPENCKDKSCPLVKNYLNKKGER